MILTLHLTSHKRNRKYKSLQLKISIFLGDFILICYSVSIVLDGTASNYLYKQNSSHMQIFAIQLQCANKHVLTRVSSNSVLSK